MYSCRDLLKKCKNVRRDEAAMFATAFGMGVNKILRPIPDRIYCEKNLGTVLDSVEGFI